MSLSDELRKLIPTPCCGQRPFVCDGLPSSCNVVVIGENPGRLMNKDWWQFWNDENGFNLRQFEQAYAEARPIGQARRRLNRLRSNGLKCLETNFFCNERLGGAGDATPNVGLLTTLINRRHLPKLKAVIVHGRKARRHWHRLGLEVPTGVQSYFLPHFILVAYAIIDELSRKIQSQ